VTPACGRTWLFAVLAIPNWTIPSWSCGRNSVGRSFGAVAGAACSGRCEPLVTAGPAWSHDPSGS
jgi:hypothetical protein